MLVLTWIFPSRKLEEKLYCYVIFIEISYRIPYTVLSHSVIRPFFGLLEEGRLFNTSGGNDVNNNNNSDNNNKKTSLFYSVL